VDALTTISSLARGQLLDNLAETMHVVTEAERALEDVFVNVRIDETTLSLPLSWREPRRVFVCSMTDLFGEWVPINWIEAVFRVMASAPQHQFQVLTKRAQRMAEFTPKVYDCIYGYVEKVPLPNVWMGVSIELDRYSWRANYLRETPAVVRFVSAEPLLGPLPHLNLTDIDWLITGGESGAHHRPLNLDWVRELRDRCAGCSTAFFHKQNGGRTHAQGGRLLDGREWNQYPEVRTLASV
jgi:protein gp37